MRKKTIFYLIGISLMTIVTFINIGLFNVNKSPSRVNLSMIEASACEDMEGLSGPILLMESCVYRIEEYPGGQVLYYYGCEDANDTCYAL